MTPSPGALPRPSARLILAIAVTAAVLALAAAGVYSARRSLAEQAVAGWLKSQKVDAQVGLAQVEPGRVRASIRVGPAADPDLAVTDADVRYGLSGPWEGRALGIRPIWVRLTAPRLKARLKGGVLSFGGLDPLIAALRRTPPDPRTPQPEILISDARLVLDTDLGRITGRASGRVAEGKLASLDLATDPAILKGPGLALNLDAARLAVQVHGDRMDLQARGRLARLAAGPATASGARLELTGQAPYPDLARKMSAGGVRLRLTAVADAAGYGPARLQGVRQSLSITGDLSGWDETLALKGLAQALVQAETGQVGTAEIRGVRLDGGSRDFRWVRAQGGRLLGEVSAHGRLNTFRQGELTLTALDLQAAGPAALKAGDAQLDLGLRLAGEGGWRGLGAVTGDDSPALRDLKRALGGFTLSAPGLRLRTGVDGLSLALSAPARLTTATGGGAVLQAPGGRLLDRDRAAFRLTLDGRGGLPAGEVSAPDLKVDKGGVGGPFRLALAGDLGPATGVDLQAEGMARLADGGFTARLSQCAPVKVRRIELGEQSLETVSGQVCAGGEPLIRVDRDGWRATAALKAVAARATGLSVNLHGGAAEVRGEGRGRTLGAEARLAAADIEDLAHPLRFRPLKISGLAKLAHDLWTGAFRLTDPAGRRLAGLDLTHDPVRSQGQIRIDTGLLAFAPEGLQPAQLSPLAGMVGAPATGTAAFTGLLGWTPKGVSSRGELTIQRLDFRSPAGPVANLRGAVRFDSLSPLHAPPGQTVQADSVGVAAPFADIRAAFGLGDDGVQVQTARVAVGGGLVSFAPFLLPLDGKTPWSATVSVDRVQVAGLVAASPLADRMELTARTSGAIPFRVAGKTLSVANGELHAVEPGRLSIRRAALSEVAAQGGAPAPAKGAPVAVDPYSDFAYQAMEHLAFTELTAGLDSVAGGRLRILLHVKGEHSPPKRQEIILTWKEAATRKFDRVLPLPSGTKVDLTLDTSLNLDQLLADYAEYQRLRGLDAISP